MKILACGLLSAMLLAGTAAALESISQPIATSGYTYYAIRADGALLAWGDSFPAGNARIAIYDDVLDNWLRELDADYDMGYCYVLSVTPQTIGSPRQDVHAEHRAGADHAGDPQITAEMARNAAKLAGIDEAIQALPEGCDTVCSDGMFSQGEWQLLSIARAAAADPAVLLLDEVTANLDAETEARVLEALRRASAGRTVLSVSHRIYENLGGRTVKIEPQSM